MASPSGAGFWMVHVTIKDEARYRDYIAAATPAFTRHGAVFLVRGGRYDAAEGLARERHIVIQFPSYDDALACYHDPDYQEAARIRLTAAETEIVIVEGVQQS